MWSFKHGSASPRLRGSNFRVYSLPGMRTTQSILVGMMLIVAVLLGAVDTSAQARTVRMAGQYGTARVFAILLPPGYDSSETRYPVVYLFHGGGQDHTAFMARSAFVPMARRHDFIVVMPAADRNYSVIGPEAQARYHDYVAGALVDYVDSNYRTIPDRAHRAIAGLSMGGRIATMTGLTHAERFATVGAFSPAIRPDAEDAVRNAPAAAPFIYLSCGTQDSLLAINREFAGWLDERELGHEYKEVPGLGHVWALWDDQIAAFFDLLENRGVKAQ